MKPEAQRIAIAEVFGWRYAGRVNDRLLMWPPLHGDWQHPPDYLNDLNAMHEAWSLRIGSDKSHRIGFEATLLFIIERDLPPKDWAWAYIPALVTNATAAQRSEAFLRTLSLWKDET